MKNRKPPPDKERTLLCECARAPPADKRAKKTKAQATVILHPSPPEDVRLCTVMQMLYCTALHCRLHTAGGASPHCICHAELLVQLCPAPHALLCRTALQQPYRNSPPPCCRAPGRGGNKSYCTALHCTALHTAGGALQVAHCSCRAELLVQLCTAPHALLYRTALQQPYRNSPPPCCRAPGRGGNKSYCTALHCTALHCTALHRTALHCTALHSTDVLRRQQGCCTALFCTVMYRKTLRRQQRSLHCTALHCTALPCTAMYCSCNKSCCAAHHCTAMHRNELRRKPLHNPTLHCNEPHCTAAAPVLPALHHPALHCTALHCTTPPCWLQYIVSPRIALPAPNCIAYVGRRSALHCTAHKYL
jgi:hypothetical protein